MRFQTKFFNETSSSDLSQIFGIYLLFQNFYLLEKSAEYGLDNSVFNVPINLNWILIVLVIFISILAWHATRNNLLPVIEAVSLANRNSHLVI